MAGHGGGRSVGGVYWHRLYVALSLRSTLSQMMIGTSRDPGGGDRLRRGSPGRAGGPEWKAVVQQQSGFGLSPHVTASSHLPFLSWFSCSSHPGYRGLARPGAATMVCESVHGKSRVRWSGFGRTEQQLSRLCRLPAATAALSLQSGAKANDALSRVCRVLRPSQGRLSGFTTEKF